MPKQKLKPARVRTSLTLPRELLEALDAVAYRVYGTRNCRNKIIVAACLEFVSAPHRAVKEPK